MSISGNVRLGGTNSVGTTTLSDKDQQAILDKLKADGLSPKFVNIGVVQLPPTRPRAARFSSLPKIAASTRSSPNQRPTHSTPWKSFARNTTSRWPSTIIRRAIRSIGIRTSVLAAIKGRTPLMGACADVGHWMRSGLDPVECLKKLEGHIICLHFKDLNEMGPGRARCAVGHRHRPDQGVDGRIEAPAFPRRVLRGIRISLGNLLSQKSPECVKFFNATCDELVATGRNKHAGTALVKLAFVRACGTAKNSACKI